MQVQASILKKVFEALHIQHLHVQIKEWKHQSETKTPERRQCQSGILIANFTHCCFHC